MYGDIELKNDIVWKNSVLTLNLSKIPIQFFTTTLADLNFISLRCARNSI